MFYLSFCNHLLNCGPFHYWSPGSTTLSGTPNLLPRICIKGFACATLNRPCLKNSSRHSTLTALPTTRMWSPAFCSNSTRHSLESDFIAIPQKPIIVMCNVGCASSGNLNSKCIDCGMGNNYCLPRSTVRILLLSLVFIPLVFSNFLTKV